MTNTLTIAAALLLSAAGIAAAQDAPKGKIMTYDVFEATVPHIDTPDCPKVVAREKVFCRLTLASEQLHLIVFSEEGDMPLLEVRPVDLNSTELKF